MAKKTAKKVARIPAKYFVAVEAGIKWLDLTFGRKEWVGRMDMSKFDIQDSNVCVAGNVFKDAGFNTGHDGYETFIETIGRKNSRRFGFSSESDRGWQYLQDIWVAKINRMKKQLHLK